jgi:hypothetical protein
MQELFAFCAKSFLGDLLRAVFLKIGISAAFEGKKL